MNISGVDVALVKPSEREEAWTEIKNEVEQSGRRLVAVDYTHPSVALGNAQWYTNKVLPFVMGTTFHTQEDADELRRIVVDDASSDPSMYAVVAPNMGKPIVVMQAMIEAASQEFGGSLEGYNLRVVESHQLGKADTSGTAKAIVNSLSSLGVHGKTGTSSSTSNKLDANGLIGEIEMIRDADEQLAYGIPAEHIAGHAFHRYELTSPDGTVQLAFEHNVCGRAVYAEGTVDAVEFLDRVVQGQHERRFWSMLDVLGQGAMQ